jgi:hypothetical protein
LAVNEIDMWQIFYALFEVKPSLMQQQGRTKVRSNFAPNQFASIPWGDPVVSGKEIERTDTFQVLSNNVNGLSSAD